jgi:hypothetical protein
MNDRRRFFRIFFILFAFALMNGFRILGNPSLAAIRTVDIVQLVATGMCLGGAVVTLVLALKSPRATER